MKAGQSQSSSFTPILCFLLNNKNITFQADMADKSKFKFAAFLSMGLLFSIYFPMAASGYLSLGDCVEENVINGLSDGALKKADHLISIRMTFFRLKPKQYKNAKIADCLGQELNLLHFDLRHE